MIEWEEIFCNVLPLAWNRDHKDSSLPSHLYEWLKGDDYRSQMIYLKDSGGMASIVNPRKRPLFKLLYEDYRKWGKSDFEVDKNSVLKKRCDYLLLSAQPHSQDNPGTALLIEITHEVENPQNEEARSDDEREVTTMERKKEQLYETLKLLHKSSRVWGYISAMAQKVCLVADKRSKQSLHPTVYNDALKAGEPWAVSPLEAEFIAPAVSLAGSQSGQKYGTEYPCPMIEALGFKYRRIVIPDTFEIV